MFMFPQTNKENEMTTENTSSAIYRLTHTAPNRKLAVACALELVKADLSSDISASGNKNRLEGHIDNLSKYADAIEAAIDNK